MTSAQLTVVGGTVTIVAAVLFVSAWAFPVLFDDPSVGGVEIGRWVAVPGHIFMLLGLVAIYGVQADETGVWGLVGFLMAFFGAAIFIGYVIGGFTAAIPEPRLGPIGGGLWLLGLLILAVVTWQAGVLPGWAGVLWMLGALVYATGVPDGPDEAGGMVALVGASGFAAGLAWAGIAIINLI